MTIEFASVIAGKLNLRSAQVQTVLELFAEGATIPFIARYRKDKTGNLDEVQIQNIQDENKFHHFKPKRKTKAQTARENGLEPLALLMLEQTETDVFTEASKYITETVKTAEEALQGARDIIAE